MASIAEYFKALWRVQYPQFEVKAGGDVASDKPPAELMPEKEIEAGEPHTSEDDVKQIGVAIAEATYAVAGYAWYGIMVCLWAAYFVFALDNQIFPTILFTVTGVKTYLSDASTVASSTAYTVQALFTAISKLVIAKMADIFGRFTALAITVFCYTLGFLIMAVSQDTNDYTGGTVFYAIGNSGVQMVIWIVLADFLSARYRMLGYAIVTLPIFITFVVGSKIEKALIAEKWRWLPGMFCILVPAVTIGLLGMLWYLERKARKSGLVPVHPYRRKGLLNALWQVALDSDFVGLLLLVGGFAMIVLPLIRAGGQYDPWSSSWVIGCLTVGPIILLFILPLYEWKIAPRPFFRRRWMNPDVLIALTLVFLDNMVFAASFQVAFYWIRVTYGFDPITDIDKANYFTNADNLSLTFFGVVAGLVILWTRRYKWFLVAGAAIRILGYGLMIRYRHLDSTMVQVVWAQIVQGIGGAFLGEILTLMAQITVRHQDVAMVTSVLLTLFSLGSSVGTAVYQSITSSQLPGKLDKYAPMLSPSQKAAVVMSPTSAFSPIASFGLGLEHGTPAGDGVSMAYNEASVHVLYFCIGVSSFLLLVTLFARDWYLPRSHNVVSAELPEKSPFRMAADKTYDHAIEEAQAPNDVKVAGTDFVEAPAGKAQPLVHDSTLVGAPVYENPVLPPTYDTGVTGSAAAPPSGALPK